jgi:hypothetical protein
VNLKGIDIEMNRLKTIPTWIPFILHFENIYNTYVIIQTFNTNFLHQHYKDVNHDCNFQMFHILCFIYTKIHHPSTKVHKFINSLKYSNP